jgi:hypothetical protein
MAIDFSLAPKISGSDYLGPLQAMELGRQSQRDQIKQQRADQQQQQHDAALQQYSAGDRAGAQKTAVASGDFDLADHLSKQDDNHRQQLTQVYGTVLQSAYALKSLPPELRQAAFDAQAPRLQAMGVPPETIAEYRGKLDDANLDAVGQQSMSVLEQIKQHEAANKPVAVAANSKLINPATGAVIADNVVAPKADWQFDSVSGSWLQKPGTGDMAAGGIPGSAPGAGGAPRSVRNNNPGNLKASPFTQGLPGYSGTDSGGFAVFDSPQSGASAQGALLGSYMDRGINTVAKIINRWAPPGDNNDTAAYIANVAKALNINPGDTLTKAAIPALQAAISRQEHGGSPSSGVSSPPSSRPGVINVRPATGSKDDENTPKLTPQAIESLAQQVASGGDIPSLGMGKSGAALKAQILNRAAELQSANGNDGAAMVSIKAARKANAASLQDLTKRNGVMAAAKNTAMSNGTLLVNAAAGGAGTTGSPVLNRWQQAYRSGVKGSPDVAAFGLAINTFANEYAKVVSGATGAAGVAEGARQEMLKHLSEASTPQQVRRIVSQARLEMASSTNALTSQIRDTQQQLRSGGADTRPGVKAPPPSAVQHLRSNPGLRAKFDEWYGQGASARVLGK